jgi:hypothetical protein
MLWTSFLSACPIWLPIFFRIIPNKPELGAGIHPGMAFTPFPSSILDETETRFEPTKNLLWTLNCLQVYVLIFTLKDYKDSTSLQ